MKPQKICQKYVEAVEYGDSVPKKSSQEIGKKKRLGIYSVLP